MKPTIVSKTLIKKPSTNPFQRDFTTRKQFIQHHYWLQLIDGLSIIDSKKIKIEYLKIVSNIPTIVTSHIDTVLQTDSTLWWMIIFDHKKVYSDLVKTILPNYLSKQNLSFMAHELHRFFHKRVHDQIRAYCASVQTNMILWNKYMSGEKKSPRNLLTHTIKNINFSTLVSYKDDVDVDIINWWVLHIIVPKDMLNAIEPDLKGFAHYYWEDMIIVTWTSYGISSLMDMIEEHELQHIAYNFYHLPETRVSDLDSYVYSQLKNELLAQLASMNDPYYISKRMTTTTFYDYYDEYLQNLSCSQQSRLKTYNRLKELDFPVAPIDLTLLEKTEKKIEQYTNPVFKNKFLKIYKKNILRYATAGYNFLNWSKDQDIVDPFVILANIPMDDWETFNQSLWVPSDI